MSYTIKQSQTNHHSLNIRFLSYGHWEISAVIRGKLKKCVTTDSIAVDNYNSDTWELNSHKKNIKYLGYVTLLNKLN